MARRCEGGGGEGLEWWARVKWVVRGGDNGDRRGLPKKGGEKDGDAKKEGKVGNMVAVQRNIGEEQF